MRRVRTDAIVPIVVNCEDSDTIFVDDTGRVVFSPAVAGILRVARDVCRSPNSANVTRLAAALEAVDKEAEELSRLVD